jgi:hypothetical protein
MRRHEIAGLRVVVVAALGFLGGCIQGPPPERSIKVSNPAYTVDQLFTDPAGNTVYRFYDNGDSRYYVVGPGGPQMTQPRKKEEETSTLDVADTIDAPGGSHSGRHRGDGGHHRK